jgi:hypothetical protein
MLVGKNAQVTETGNDAYWVSRLNGKGYHCRYNRGKIETNDKGMYYEPAPLWVQNAVIAYRNMKAESCEV